METNKPAQPVFTQAMADNGELPQIGMLCLINFPDIDNAWYEYTIDFIGKHMVVATCKEVAERTGHIDNVYFKPIDTRTNNYSCFSGCLIPKPSQPVFTQAMADNGESIKAGMLFQYNSGEKTELLLPIDESGMGVAMFDGEYCIVCQSGMLPIDTRTNKEKAVDEIREEYLAYTGEVMGAFEFAYDKWVGE